MLKFINFIILSVLILFNTNLYAATFKGKVIDADTKQPIEGAVVVATWHEERATPAGSTSRLKDVKETLTDKNGEWVIEGPRGRDMGNITAYFTLLTGIYITNPPLFIVFKPGYCPWSVEAFGIDACKGKLKPLGTDKVAGGETVELPMLTNKKDRLKALPSRVSGYSADEKQNKFIELLNEERRHLGLEEY